MKRDCNIVIVGAGVTGLTVAALLGRGPHALPVTVIDAGVRPEPADAGDIALRVSAIAMGSVDILDGVGAWGALDTARTCPYDHMRVWDQDDEPGGAATLRFDADEFGVPHLGYIVENKQLLLALLESLERSKVELRFEAPLASVEVCGNGHTLILEDGEKMSAGLVIAADGARSLVRDSLGMQVSRRPYEQTAFVTHLQPSIAHAGTAWQRFLRAGPIGLLPLCDGRVSVVWTTTPDKAKQAEQSSDAELSDVLTRMSDGILGRLQVAGPRGSFPLAAQHAEEYVRHGVALIGDAAHTIHPLAGQGANLGLADAAALAEVVNAALDKGEHAGDRPVLRRYERQRKGANASMMHLMTGLNRLFAADSAILGEVRRLGMTLFNKSGPIRQRITGVALGR